MNLLDSRQLDEMVPHWNEPESGNTLGESADAVEAVATTRRATFNASGLSDQT